MLTRLIAALLLKAVLSLAALLGIASYAHHLAGGDPGALWQRVASHAFGGAARSIDGLGARIGSPVAALVAGTADEKTGLTSVWSWQDANGVTHYTDLEPPAGVDATIVGVDPDVNVLAPVAASVAPSVVTSSIARPATNTVRDGARAGGRGRGADSEAEGPLPGIGGVFRRAREESVGVDPGEAAALLRMLQGSSR